MSEANIERAKMIEVIEILEARGQGTPGDPARIVTTYWSKEGKKLAERDPAYARSIASACSNAKSESIK